MRRTPDFYWTGKTPDSKNASIAWTAFYNPKVAGGWGLFNMQVWNKAAILKLLWDVTFKNNKLWVKWIHAYYLKKHTIYNVTISSNISW